MEARMSTRGNPGPKARRSGRKRKVGLDASQMYEESKKEKVLSKVFESMKSSCLEVIEKLTTYDFAVPFLQPVDATLPGCERYYELIKDPMDFTTLKSKMEQRLYGSLDEWIDDVRVIFTNCYTYNQIGSEICNYAGALSMMFERQLDGLRDKEDELLEDAELAEMKSTMQQLYEEQAKMMQELTKLKLESENPQPTIVYQQAAPIAPKKTNPKQVAKPQKKKKGTSTNPKKPAQSTFNKKRKAELTRNVTILSQQPQYLDGIVQIVQAELPKDKQEGEVELDLDAMSTQTLLKLENYVNQCMGKSSYSGPSVRRKKLHPEDYDEASNLSRGEESSSSDDSEGELDVVF